jgi:hypothetical protein
MFVLNADLIISPILIKPLMILQVKAHQVTEKKLK